MEIQGNRSGPHLSNFDGEHFGDPYIFNIFSFSDTTLVTMGDSSPHVAECDLLSNCSVGVFLDVMVAEIFSPAKFYVQVCESFHDDNETLISGQTSRSTV